MADLKQTDSPYENKPERQRVLGLLRAYGWNATSFQVLEHGFHYFFTDDACVAYVPTPNAWVAAGAPIAALERQREVAEAFIAAARAAGRRALFALTEERFVAVSGLRALRIGEQPSWDPRAWRETLASHGSLREQLRRARAKGVRVRRVHEDEVARPEQPLRRAIEGLVARWLISRNMASLGFLVHVQLFDFARERRLWVAEDASGLQGVAALVPIYTRSGFLLEDLLRAPNAPNGTTELLIDHAMRECAADGCSYLTLGLAPLAGELPSVLRALRSLGRGLYDFRGLRAFKAKLLPSAWSAIYLSYPQDESSLVAVYDLLAAFARGSLLRFGWASLLRGPRVVVAALTVLLVPWTCGLALLDTQHYFPAPWVKWAWVGFDCGLLAALALLLRNRSPQLAAALTVLIASDASLTLLEVLSFNIGRARGVAELLALACAVAAPALAAAVLRNVWRRNRALAK
jgi:phosphatidylglycerol lysyltransferase